MNVVSLFDGMSCGMVALERAGIEVDTYYASEIDKYALTVSHANYPEIVRLGDVQAWSSWNIPWGEIDLVIAGSPCQGFSFAGKQLAFDDPRSKLFFTFVDILNVIKKQNPNVKFMLENVKMKKEFLEVISEQVGVEPVFINSALVSAQNRQRYYWTNWEFGQPEDRGIMLKDILEETPLEFTLMSDKFVNRQKGRKCLIDDTKEKAASLSAMEYVKNGRQGDYLKCDIKGGRITGRYLVDGKRQDGKMKTAGLTTQYLEVREDGKTNCLSTVQKDNVVVKIETGEESTIRDKSKCVRSGGRKSYDRHEWDSVDELHYRKLTVVECERLQTVPDGYTEGVSNTQRYKMLGNGWNVDAIAHIFQGLKNAT